MALFNESLEGRFNQAVQRLHGIKGGPVVPQVAPEIDHSITLENDRPENMYLLHTHLWAGRVQIAGAATFNSMVGIRNPTGSGVLVVVTEARVSNTTLVAQNYAFTARAQAVIVGGNIGITFYRDARKFLAGGNPAVQTLSVNNVAGQLGSGPLEVIQLAASEGERDFETSLPFVLVPGFEIFIVCQAANVALDADFSGYFRPLAAMDLL